MVRPEDLESLVGERVILQLSTAAQGEPVVAGRIVGVLRALDGLVVTIAPDGAESTGHLTYHYHYVESAKRVAPPKT